MSAAQAGDDPVQDDAVQDDAVQDDQVQDEQVRDERTPREERPGDSWIVALLFALGFGYDTVEAVANHQQLPLLYLGSGIEGSTPWWLLVAGIALPALLFLAALWIGRGMRLVPKAGVLLVALAVSAQLSLLAEQLARQIAVAALGG
ncbi:hypothetical protein AA0Z99_01910 [Agrococcus sp. 1P02AA]|uniref:hypothetical protein n=1 Tax=Agrococcus sp. 1P02AA TaxID=3132259 RepID=UPI0039A5E83B